MQNWLRHKYKVVSRRHEFADEFEEEVQELLNDEWELNGSLQVNDFALYQSLTKSGLD
ncbi:hypothetical protein [Vibrio phage TCU-VP03-AIR1]